MQRAVFTYNLLKIPSFCDMIKVISTYQKLRLEKSRKRKAWYTYV